MRPITMKLLLGLVIFSSLIFNLKAETPHMLNITVLLRAIAEIETGNDDSAIGKAGERSRYQIKKDVWFQYAKVPFESNASNVLISREVARKHITNMLIRVQTAKPGVVLTPRDFYIIWNAGFAFYLNRDFNFSRVVRYEVANPAKRFENLYNLFLKEEEKNLTLAL